MLCRILGPIVYTCVLTEYNSSHLRLLKFEQIIPITFDSMVFFRNIYPGIQAFHDADRRIVGFTGRSSSMEIIMSVDGSSSIIRATR